MRGPIRWRIRLGVWLTVAVMTAATGIAVARHDQLLSAFHAHLERWASRETGRSVRIGSVSGSWRTGLILRDVEVGQSAAGDAAWTATVEEAVVTPGLWRWVWPAPRSAYRVHLQSPVVRWVGGGGTPPTQPVARSGYLREIEVLVDGGQLLLADNGSAAPLVRQVNGLLEWRREKIRVVRAQGLVADAWCLLAGEYVGDTHRWQGHAEVTSTILGGRVNADVAGQGLAGRLSGRADLGELVLAAQGTLDVAHRRLRLSLRRVGAYADMAFDGAVHLTAWELSPYRMAAQVQLDGLRLHDHRLSGRLLAVGRHRPGRAVWDGSVLVRDVAIDEAPIAPIRARLRWRPDRCVVKRLTIGRRFRLAGAVDVMPPFRLNGQATLDRIGLGDLAGLSRLRLRDEAAGTLTGTLTFDGALPTPWVHGSLRAGDIAMGALRYPSAHLQFQGPWPAVQFHDSTLVSPGGSTLQIEGHLDLRDLGTPTVFRDVDVVTAQGSTVWQGWDLAQHAGTADRLTISRQMSDGLAIGFRAFVNDDREGRTPDDEVELRYRLSEHQNVKVGVTRQEEFMGVEHRWQF